MKHSVLPCLFVLLLTMFSPIIATDFLDRPDGHAPISLMADHVHHQGEWMLSTRVMRMTMRGIQQADSTVSKDTYFSNTNYMKYPQDMEMWMAMLGIMYAPSDTYTVMLMLNYASSDMRVSGGSGQIMGQMSMSTASSSRMSNQKLTDMSISFLSPLWQSDKATLVGQVGLRVPMTEANAKDENMTLAYPMQFSGATYDAKLGLTYTHNNDSFSWGTQLSANFPLGKNNVGYHLGNSAQLSTWLAKPLTTWLSVSTRVSYQTQARISGFHKDIVVNAMTPMNPLLEAENSGFKSVLAALGINVNVKPFGRFAVETEFPLSQYRVGYQMPLENKTVLGWQKLF